MDRYRFALSLTFWSASLANVHEPQTLAKISSVQTNSCDEIFKILSKKSESEKKNVFPGKKHFL
jgi:hypothetical protein